MIVAMLLSACQTEVTNTINPTTQGSSSQFENQSVMESVPEEYSDNWGLPQTYPACTQGGIDLVSLSFPTTKGCFRVGGMAEFQADDTTALIGVCNNSVWEEAGLERSPDAVETINSVEEVFPAYSDQLSLTFTDLYYRSTTHGDAENLDITIDGKESVEINGYKMCKYSGVFNFLEDGEEQSKKYVAYALQLQQCHGEYVYLVSIVNREESADVYEAVEKDALYMACSFCEEEN